MRASTEWFIYAEMEYKSCIDEQMLDSNLNISDYSCLDTLMLP